MKKFNRILALVLAVLTVVSTMSVGVFAATTCPGEDVQHTLTNCVNKTLIEHVKEASCEIAGYYLYECNDCGVQFKIVDPAIAHTVGEYTVKTPATCEEDGVKVAYCTVCELEVEKAIPATGHDYKEEMTVSPTEVTSGEVVISCGNCDFEKVLVIAPSCDHTKTPVTETPATCTAEGKMAHLYCATCDIYVIVVDGKEVVVAEEDLVIEKLDHVAGDPVIVDSNCVENTLAVYCTECGTQIGDTYTEAKDAEHTWFNPTTGLYGLSNLAAVQGLVSVDDIVIDINEGWYPVDSLGNIIFTANVAYPCGKDVAFQRQCTTPNCGVVETTVVEAKGHTYGSVECSYYSERYNREFSMPFTSAVQAPAGFCEDGGIYTITCAFCGNFGKEIRNGEKNADGTYHIWVEDHENCVDPTCTLNGKHVYECLVCGVAKAYEEADKIPATGHSYEPVVTSAHCAAEGYTQDVCSVCGDVKKDDDGVEIKYDITPIDPEKHSGTDGAPEWHTHKYPTCTEDGYGSYFCANCDKVDSTLVTIPAGHTWGDPVVVEATCTVDGTSTITCTVPGCGVSKVTPIPATGHNPALRFDPVTGAILSTKLSNATCHSAAIYEAVCTADNCGAVVPTPYGDTVPCELDTIIELLRDPTCSMVGYYYGTCKWASEDNATNKHVCEVYFPIETIDHDYSVVVADTYVAPTCTTAGKASDMKCSMCDAVQTGAPIGTIAHSYVEIGTDTTAPDYDPENVLNPIGTPTCGQFARTYQVCSECGLYDFVDGTFADRLSDDGKHQMPEEGTEDLAPSCTTEGVMTWYCANTGCGEALKTEAIPMIKHKHVITAADPANGVEEEAAEWFNCAELEDNQYTCDTCGHGHVVTSDFRAGTCQTYPSIVTYCHTCGVVFANEVTDMTWGFDHDYVETETKAAICVHAGEKANVCTACGAVEEGSVVEIQAPATDHTWDAGKTIVNPTVSSEGKVLYTCEVCGDTKEETIPAFSHALMFDYAINHVTEKDGEKIVDELNIVNTGLIALTIKTSADNFDLMNIALKLNYNPDLITFVGFDCLATDKFADYDAVVNAKKGILTVFTATAKVNAGASAEDMKDVTLNGVEDYMVVYFRVNDDVIANTEIMFKLDDVQSAITKADGTEYVHGIAVDGKSVSFGVTDTSKVVVTSKKVVALGDVLASTLRPGVVNASDLVAIANIYFADDEALYVSEADINRDGKISLADYALVKWYVLNDDYEGMLAKANA